MALILWIVLFVVLFPVSNVTEIFSFVAGSLLSHFVYGATLGFTFGALGGEHHNW